MAALVLAPITVTANPAAASPGQSVSDLSTVTIDEVVATLLGPGVSVSNVSYVGDPRAAGIFSGMDAVGVADGVVLSSGKVTDMPGPYGLLTSTALGRPGDPDATMLAGRQTHDAAVLEFDFVPDADSLTIDYVFGSAEYNDWVGRGYSDVFGFFIDGVNCALVDGDPVHVDTVNRDVRPELYVDNTGGAFDTRIRGFTKPLTCSANVTKSVVHHAKLVIADARDGILDAFVLIGAQRFASNAPPRAADLVYTVPSGESVSVEFPGEDDDGDELTYAITTPPAHGDFVPSATGGGYTPAEGFSGVDVFEYTVSDGHSTAGPYQVQLIVTVATQGPAPDPEEDADADVDTGADSGTEPDDAADGGVDLDDADAAVTPPGESVLPSPEREPGAEEVNAIAPAGVDGRDTLAITGANLDLGAALGLAALLAGSASLLVGLHLRRRRSLSSQRR